METINYLGKYVVESLAFFFIVGVAIWMVLLFFTFISVLFFSEGTEDSRYKRMMSTVFLLLRSLRIVWWAGLITALAWIAIGVIAKIVHG